MSRLIAGSPYSLNVLNKKNELDDLELEILGREGKRGFVSWILEDDGRITDPMTFTDGKVVPL